MILRHGKLLEQFAEQCSQLGAMHWLGYFLGGKGALWKHPCVVLILNPGARKESLQLSDLRGAAMFYEIGAIGVGSGAFSTDDWEGMRTVIAPLKARSRITALAVEALMQQGAHIVLATYSCKALDDPAAGAMIQYPATLWAEHSRDVTKQRLLLKPSYEETLAQFGKQTRFNLRYYRKRLLAGMGCEFFDDAHAVLTEDDVLRLNKNSLNPIPSTECIRRYRATRDLPGGFLIALRSPKGKLLSVLGGWRQGSTTVMHHQINIAGYEKSSLGTVMRSFFLENEVGRGTRTLIFYHGTNHSMSHAFESDVTRDLVVRRTSLRASLLRRMARFLVSSAHYTEAHYFGGSTSFLAAALTTDTLSWNNSVSADLT
jgi:hypothetical protein